MGHFYFNLSSPQKLYKFINCVELVSPHHSAKELANSLRTGQIMGLFQKSVKRVSFGGNTSLVSVIQPNNSYGGGKETSRVPQEQI